MFRFKTTKNINLMSVAQAEKCVPLRGAREFIIKRLSLFLFRKKHFYLIQ